MNANYMKVAVTVFHNKQMRIVHLHVVQRANKENLYFLFDFFGYAIDDSLTLLGAVSEFLNNRFTVLEN